MQLLRRTCHAVVVIAAGFVAACDGGSAPASTSSSAPRAPGAASSSLLAVGQRIVAATSKTNFREGSVVMVSAQEIEFAWGTKRSDGTLERSKVRPTKAWPIGHGSAALAVGDYAICRVAELTWVPCRIAAEDPPSFAVLTHRGERHSLGREALVRPDEATRGDIQALLDREQRHRIFDRAFATAGRPAGAADWTPAKGDAVVGRFAETSWYSGKVTAIDAAGRLEVAWDGKGWDPQQLARADVAPLPAPAAASEWSFGVGQFVIVRPRVDGWRWEHGKIVAVRAAELEVVDRDNRKRDVKKADALPLVGPL